MLSTHHRMFATHFLNAISFKDKNAQLEYQATWEVTCQVSVTVSIHFS